MNAPTVSVVLSVYNAGAYLEPSLHSILSQEGVDFEVVAVEDGSTDCSSAILDEFARRDPRLRVLHQENQGLTWALIRGCHGARGEFIARHDADDLSLPGRLARQAEMLRAEGRLAFVSCRSRVIGPDSELLFETASAADSVRATDELLRHINGPYHGSVMFRVDAYRRAGGYRAEFRYAQDWDLWLRLVEHGRFGFAPETLYAFRVSEASISSGRRAQQQRLAEVAWECYNARARGEPEQALLNDAARISAEPALSNRRMSAGGTYFIGKCLLDRRDRRAIPYLRRSVRHDPWRWRHWAALAAAALVCRPNSNSSALREGPS